MSQHATTRGRNRFEHAGHRRASPSFSDIEGLRISVIFSISRMTSRNVTHCQRFALTVSADGHLSDL